jgi:hypothetical protein
MFVPCILDRQYIIIMYVVMPSEAVLPQYLNCQTVDLHCLKEFCHVYLTRWVTICVSCHNSIVHSHQVCSTENAFAYTFKYFCCLRCMLYLIQ